MTLVAALVAATAALLVVLIDRVIVATAERRRSEKAVRREIYARFMGGIMMTTHYLSHGDAGSSDYVENGKRAAAAFTEILLVAPEPVRNAAGGLLDAIAEIEAAVEAGTQVDASSAANASLQAFLQLARKDVSS